MKVVKRVIGERGGRCNECSLGDEGDYIYLVQCKGYYGVTVETALCWECLKKLEYVMSKARLNTVEYPTEE